jgi:alkaline phosphatase D
MDQWPGYAHERAQLLQFLAEQHIANPIVLTGDIHANWVNELRVDDRDAKAKVIATEFVGTSISSGGDGGDASAEFAALQPNNPGVRFLNRQRGYVACTVTDAQWTSDYYVVDQVKQPGGKVSKAASFTVEAGRAGVRKA